MLILLLGAHGQLGKAFLSLPEWQGFKTINLNRKQLDICNLTALKHSLEYLRPDVIINCAAFTNVDLAEVNQEHCYLTNTLAVKEIAQWCGENDRLFINFSTDYVFDGGVLQPYVESDLTSPLNVYGHSKLNAEIAVEGRCSKFLILRTSWLFSEFDNGFFSTMTTRALDRKYSAVINDQFGCPTSAKDLARIIMKVLVLYRQDKKLPFGKYHLAGNWCCTWYDYAKQIYLQVSENSASFLKTLSSPYPGSSANRPLYSCLNSNLFQQTFGLSLPDTQVALAEAVEQFTKRYQSR